VSTLLDKTATRGQTGRGARVNARGEVVCDGGGRALLPMRLRPGSGVGFRPFATGVMLSQHLVPRRGLGEVCCEGGGMRTCVRLFQWRT
jgi:hypothetical protein